MRPIAARRLLSLAVALVLSGCAASAPPPPATVPTDPIAPTAAFPSVPAPSTFSPSPPAAPSSLASPSQPAMVSDDLSKRPFTVLVLGGDNGFRTDATIVVGIDPVHRKLSLASIPRDTVNLPLPGGGTFSNKKVNAFYQFAAKHPGRYPHGPGRATADFIGKTLGIHIDFYAATSFDGFVKLVNAMDGVRVTLPKAVVDPHYEITTTKIGVRFPAGRQVLKGPMALVFARTRQGDNDFERQRRQQLFLLAAGRQLLAHPSLVAGLLAAQRNLRTDFPLDQVPGLVDALDTAGSWPAQQVVLGPTKYESAASCPCGYALQPRLGPMRAAAKVLFPWAVAP